MANHRSDCPSNLQDIFSCWFDVQLVSGPDPIKSLRARIVGHFKGSQLYLSLIEPRGSKTYSFYYDSLNVRVKFVIAVNEIVLVTIS